MFSHIKELFTRPSGYTISRSVRLRSSASGYFSRTPASATNRQTWTWSGWIKRGSLASANYPLFAGNAASSDAGWLQFNFTTSDTFSINGWTTTWRTTTQVFRDPSAWYHIVVVWDTTQSTASNRVKLYVNGQQVTAFGTSNDPSLNATSGVNAAAIHNVGGNTGGSSFFDGYLTEINFIDGQALTPSSFGETDSITGVWKAKKYSGTYGTNGFYLNFSDNSSNTATTIGKDYSGNGNNWTPNNISVTSGSTYDSMIDVPTLTSATAANYCVGNPLDNSGTLSSGNLTFVSGGSNQSNRATFQLPSSGKFYAECTLGTTTSASVGEAFGYATASASLTGTPNSSGKYVIYADSTGGIYSNGSTLTSSLGTFASGTVLQIAYDGNTGNAWVGKNNTWYNSTGGTTGDPSAGSNPTFTSLSSVFPFTQGINATQNLNFGQQPFTYTPPTGFVALNTYNLPASTITNGAAYMAATTYTGNGSTQSISNAVNGVSFQPDLVWGKSRSAATSHLLVDSVRGTGVYLLTNSTAAEGSASNTVTSFNSGGFSLGADTTLNTNASTYVGWQWKAGGSSSSNTNGSITSTVSVGATQGFSVVTYTGTGANATVGHGLGVAPSMIIVKKRSGANAWFVGATPAGWNKYLLLNTTDASATDPGTVWQATAPTSSVFYLGTTGEVNANTATFVAYCFAAVAGYSAFGSYTGNGSADGPFVFLGFRPRYIMIKCTTASNSWVLEDTSRDTYNPAGLDLFAESSGAEVNNIPRLDILSNGFKLRNTYGGSNASSATYIYACFAENPFKNSLAR